ncbi:hypothetical protein [Bacterioplanoides pacificum]|uniref:5-methyltetrahydrofolate--homocysteine methyltransferase n=1 Tax=Bacterioplanoides pacificum TaxID=1171596 RepID=A0ABV7VYC5_9GAMM
MEKKFYSLSAVLVSLALTGCGSDSSSNDNSECHDPSCFAHTDSGRLMVSSADSAALSVLNLENNEVLDTFALTHKASSLYASPGYRYGIAMYRDDDGLVEVIDGGQYQEDHGDHLHPYEKDPSKLNVSIAGANPTHYEIHAGRGAIFFDGAEGVVSKVVEFGDAQLAAGTANSFELASAHHGTAEPLGEHILVSNKGDSASSLPEKVDLFHFHDGDGFELDQTFDETCPGLHGSFTTEEGSVFGCTDGVLVIKEGDNHAFMATKIANIAAIGDSRIGSFSGYAESHLVAGWADDNLFAIDLENMSMELVDWNGAAEDVTKNNAHMSANGEYMLVLDSTGTLHILSGVAEHEHDAGDAHDAEQEAHGFVYQTSIKVLNVMPEPVQGHAGLRQPRVSMVSSPAMDFAYVVDSVTQQVVVVHLEDAEVENRIKLSFTPAQVAWVGIASSDHDHDHEDDEAHNHD